MNLSNLIVLKEFFKRYAPTVKMWQHKRTGFKCKYQKPPKKNLRTECVFTEEDKAAIKAGLEKLAAEAPGFALNFEDILVSNNSTQKVGSRKSKKED